MGEYSASSFVWKNKNYINLESYFQSVINSLGGSQSDGVNYRRSIPDSVLRDIFRARSASATEAWYYYQVKTIYITGLTLEYNDNVKVVQWKYINQTAKSLKTATVHNSSELGAGDFPSTLNTYVYIEIDWPHSYGFLDLSGVSGSTTFSSTDYPYYKYKKNGVNYYKTYSGQTVASLKATDSSADADSWALLRKPSKLFLGGTGYDTFSANISTLTTQSASTYQELKHIDTNQYKNQLDNYLKGYKIGGRSINNYSMPSDTDAPNTEYRSSLEKYPSNSNTVVGSTSRDYWAFTGKPSLILDSNWNGDTLEGSIEVKNNMVKVISGGTTKYYPFDALNTIVFFKRNPVEHDRSKEVRRPLYVTHYSPGTWLDAWSALLYTTNSSEFASKLISYLSECGYSYKVVEGVSVTYSPETIWGTHKCKIEATGTCIYDEVYRTYPKTLYAYFKVQTGSNYTQVELFYDADQNIVTEQGNMFGYGVSRDFNKGLSDTDYGKVVYESYKPVGNKYTKNWCIHFGREWHKYIIEYGYTISHYTISLKDYPQISYNSQGITLNGTTYSWGDLTFSTNHTLSNNFQNKFCKQVTKTMRISRIISADHFSSAADFDKAYMTDGWAGYGNYSNRDLNIGMDVYGKLSNIPVLSDYNPSSSTVSQDAYTNAGANWYFNSSQKKELAYYWAYSTYYSSPGTVGSIICLTRYTEDAISSTIYNANKEAIAVVFGASNIAYTDQTNMYYAVWLTSESTIPALTLWGGSKTNGSINL